MHLKMKVSDFEIKSKNNRLFTKNKDKKKSY